MSAAAEESTPPADKEEDGSSTARDRRNSHLTTLIAKSRRSIASLRLTDSMSIGQQMESVDEESEAMHESLRRRFTVFEQQDTTRLVEVRVKDLSYHVPMRMGAPAVKTVLNQSVCYGVYEFFKRMSLYCKKGRQESRRSSWLPRTTSDVFHPFASKPILRDINLVLKPGTTYLILGPPGCGKTSLLKAIAGRLPNHMPSSGDPPKSKAYQTGRVEYNGVSTEDDPEVVLANVCSFVGQLDNHAAYLTVAETFEFAFQCRTGGELKNVGIRTSGDSDAPHFSENLTIDGLDLTQCANTFVGDDNVRGVSGGQRRRVTVGEMMQGANPVACADEFSTGLDAAVTHDIAFSIVRFAKAAKTTRIVSLLQPGPETFSLFDEVIVLSEGYVIYSGPIDDVVDYFAGLGYEQPERMDVADFLQSIPTPDGELLFDPSKSTADEHFTSEEFANAFKESAQYARILNVLNASSPYSWTPKQGSRSTDEEGGGGLLSGGSKGVPKEFKVEWQNSFWRSSKLNFRRNFTLWKRDKGFIIGKMFENIGMAVATGGILFGQARLTFSPDDTESQTSEKTYRLQAGVYGALFMTCFHILLGTMTSTPDEIDTRSIHYKHYDAKFYQVYAFVLGRFLSTIPQRSLEIVSFGIPLYFLVGLDLSAASFFIYLVLLICYTIGLKMMFGILAQTLPKKANVQGVGTFIVLLATLFGGFIVYPNAIPAYYIWIYWANPMAWALQGLASNEFTSTKYDGLAFSGDTFLTTRGFQTGREWIGYAFAFMVPFTLIFTVLLGIVLKSVRIEPEQAQAKKKKEVSIGEFAAKSEEDFNIPFTPVDVTFDKLVYEVKAHTGNETLRLLNEVSGAFVAGRMCALMGSSGAGKTTLMDVIAMRKTSGTIIGEIRLNGFSQERTSFLRCSGYVEQFDVQQAELTVRETVTFCARLRLDSKDPAIGNDAGKLRYVDHVLETMELTDIQNLQVGSYEEGGLTFEQRKRLAIACELAGSPSVLFLDEPTSGLDSRGALVVMRAMRRIADSGRTVCATIHQPSAAVFEMFDDLILLVKGGNVVFFGELGQGSSKLVEYFESRGADPIEYGQNPAAWMLSAISNDGSDDDDVDWAEVYKMSDQYSALRDKIETIVESADESKRVTFDSTYAMRFGERLKLMNQRIITVYKRSPAYNLARLMIAIFYSFLIGSVFIRSRRGKNTVWQETDADGILSTMFLSLIIMGVMSISMAVPVMKKIRDVFYKHRASGMLGHNSLSWSLQVGETGYLCLIAFLFAVVYYVTVGLFNTVSKFALFWVFTILNIANYTYFGQAFICLVKDVATAGALQGALIGYNVFFSGLIVKPQYFNGPFQLGLWTAPGRFAFEGITMTQFSGLTIPVQAENFSPYFLSLGCDQTTIDAGQPCVGTMDDYVQFYFGGKFTIQNFWLDVGVLLGYLVLARLLTWFALKKFNYVNT